MHEDEMDLEVAPVTVGDMEGEVNEPPLTEAEEKDMNDNLIAKEKAELMDYWDNVLGMKALLDDHTVQNAMFKVLDGNIAALRDQLEIEDKPREVTKAQGKLEAFKQMRDFPASAVEQFKAKLYSVRTNWPLFVEEDPFIQGAEANYDERKHKITIYDPTEDGELGLDLGAPPEDTEEAIEEEDLAAEDAETA